MTLPIRILSDLHLGHRFTRLRDPQALRPLLEGTSQVIFNGDTWQEIAAPSARERSRAALETLKALCQDCGTKAVFLPGNHDPGWEGPGWAEIADGKVVVTHGDALFREASPWKRTIMKHPERIEEIFARFPEAAHDPVARHEVARCIAREMQTLVPSGGRSFLRRSWDALVPPQRALEIVSAWYNQALAGGEFTRTYFPQAKALIIGHFHRAGMWRSDKIRIINTGSFISPGRAWCVEWDGERLKRYRIAEKKGGSCTLMPRPDRYPVD